MDATLNAKLNELGLTQRGVLTPTQKMLAALESDGSPQSAIEGAPDLRRAVALATVAVEGASHAGESAACAADLAVGSTLDLVHDVENPTSPHAVMLLDKQGRKLGYVPNVAGEVVCNLLAARKQLVARVEHIDAGSPTPEISVTVLMRDN